MQLKLMNILTLIISIKFKHLISIIVFQKLCYKIQFLHYKHFEYNKIPELTL